MATSSFDRISNRSPKHSKIFVSKSLDIAERLNELLVLKGMTQNELAKKLNKRPSEISKWLSGLHNFTLRSIAKIEAALDEPIIQVVSNPLIKKEEVSINLTVFAVIKEQDVEKLGSSKKIVWKAPGLTMGGVFLDELNINSINEDVNTKQYSFEDAEYIELDC